MKTQKIERKNRKIIQELGSFEGGPESLQTLTPNFT
jgi:hypothetical protein